MTAADPISGALERTMARFGAMLRAIGRRRGLSDADLDELAQDVRVRLWRALAEREKIDSVQTSYVYRAAVSAALDIVRRRRSRAEEPIEAARAAGGKEFGVIAPAVAFPDAPDIELERVELGERIDRAIAELSEAREVVVRLHLSGYKRFEIAQMLGWTEPRVRNLIYRGLSDLRAMLLRAGISPERMP